VERKVVIDASGLFFKELNESVRKAVREELSS